MNAVKYIFNIISKNLAAEFSLFLVKGMSKIFFPSFCLISWHLIANNCFLTVVIRCHTFYNFNPFSFPELCVMICCLDCLCSMHMWKELVLCRCWVEHSISVKLFGGMVQDVYIHAECLLLISVIPHMVFKLLSSIMNLQATSCISSMYFFSVFWTLNASISRVLVHFSWIIILLSQIIFLILTTLFVFSFFLSWKCTWRLSKWLSE